jgi:hypothetical protein
MPITSNSTDFIDEFDTKGFLARFLATTVEMAERLTTTNQGHVFMAPCRARKDDAVCVLLRCSMPVVLQGQKGEDLYEFIGECYLYGFLNGNVLDKVDSPRGNMQSFRLS